MDLTAPPRSTHTDTASAANDPVGDPIDDPTIATTVDAARNGDRAAFARLHSRYAPMVHGILLARVPGSDAQDLVQDVFTRAIDAIAGLRAGESVGAWLASLARNIAADFHRRRYRRDQSHLPSQPFDSTEAIPDQRSSLSAADREEAHRVLTMIRTLPDAYSETLMLRLVEGFTGPQIAQRTGLTPGSVRVNLHRGMQMLRERLAWEPIQ